MEMIPKEVLMRKAREQGYKEGIVMGELKSMVRIKKEMDKYIKKHKELKDNRDDLINIILGVKL